MIDAYTVGITLALENGVSAGLAAIRRDLAELDRAVEASALGLARLRQAASSALTAAGTQRPPAVRPEPPSPAAPTPDPAPLSLARSPATPRATPAATPPERPTPAVAPTTPSRPPDAPLPAPAEPRPPATSSAAPTPPRVSTAPLPEPPVQFLRPIAKADPAPAGAPQGSVRHRTSSAESVSSAVAPVHRQIADVRSTSYSAPLPAPPSRTERIAAPVESLAPVAPPRAAVTPQPATSVDLAFLARSLLPRHTKPVHAPAEQSKATSFQPPVVPLPRLALMQMPVPPPVPQLPLIKPPVLQLAPLRSPEQPPAAPALTPPAAPAIPLPRMVAPERSAAPPPRPRTEPTQIQGDVYFDGERVGRWLSNHLARSAARPPAGATGFDPRLSPLWAGATVGP